MTEVKTIRLTKGRHAIVDAADYEWLSQWKWYFGAGYAMRGAYTKLPSGKWSRTTVYMQRVIMSTPHDMETDHRDGNKLNNSRSNLRICTHSQNQHNKPKINHRSSSRFKGVTWHKKERLWHAQLELNNRNVHIGRFLKEENAALAYNLAALSHFGEFANFNINNL
jgi:hypothetical protein